jgi:presenilin-like A22 family membrane protease
MRVADADIDGWFKYRILFLLAVVVAYTVKLIFLTEMAVGNFESGADAQALSNYLQYRAGFVVLISAVYLYSYLKNWYFEQVSLICLGVGVTALFLDYFNAYTYLSQTPAQWVVGLIALRFMALFCLLMNAMSARHAPPMPRRLWA